MTTYVSGSRVSLASKCAASMALPQVRHSSAKADSGSAGHDHLRDRTLFPIEEAFARLPEHCARWGLDEVATSVLVARCRSFQWMPPQGTMAEVALGLMEDGTVQIVKGARGSYEGPSEMRIATRIDAFWAQEEALVLDGDRVACPSDSVVFAIDYKFGQDRYVAPIEENLQALAGAVLAGLWTGARRVMPAIVYPTKGLGDWHTLEKPLTRDQLLEGRDLLLSIAERANRERAKYAAQEPLTYNEGAHCEWCDAAVHCPAKVAMIKSFVGSAEPFEAGVELSEEESSRFAMLMPMIEGLLRTGKAALKRRVEHTGRPIPIEGSPNVWGPHLEQKKAIDPVEGFAVLKGVVGEELAREALRISISEDAMRAAVKKLHEANGIERQGAATMRSIFRDLHAREAVSKKTEVHWGAYRPSAELPPSDPPSALPEAPSEAP